MSTYTGVTSAAKGITGTTQAIRAARESKGQVYTQNASEGRLQRLKGEIEHSSHEIAVNRYMNPSAKREQAKANAIFAAVLIASLITLSVLFSLINLSQ
ncbi:hypothetical protein [Eoetvoesiella caeni]